jgi:hypothetical protein
MLWRNNTMTFLPLSNNCDKKIIKLYIPVNDISPNNIRASTIQLKLGGNNCCGFSNVVNIAIPPVPPPPPTPEPDVCIPDNLDLYGYTAIVSYDPVNCTAGHVCNRAIFDFYIDNTLIGRANLNNLDTGGYKESVFVINEHIITTGSTSIRLDCALAACHNGIGRVVIKDPQNNIALALCLPNDVAVGSLLCPTPTPTITPNTTPTITSTPTPTPTITSTSLLFNFTDPTPSFTGTFTSSTYTDGPSHGRGSSAFVGGVLTPSGKVVLVPYSSSTIGIYDPVANTYTDGPSHGRGSGAFWGGVLTPSGKVVLVPHGSSTVGIYDPVANTYTDGPSHGRGGGAFIGGVLTPSGKVVLVPYNSSTVGILSPDPLLSVSSSTAMSPYLNKL